MIKHRKIMVVLVLFDKRHKKLWHGRILILINRHKENK